MSVISTLRRYFGLDPKGELGAALQKIGVDAVVLPGRGHPEEKINTNRLVFPSRGIVTIRAGPIRHVHMIETLPV